MKKFIITAAALALVACTNNKKPDLVPAENFADIIDSVSTSLYTLRGGDPDIS